MAPTPAPIPRPKLARWLFDRGLSTADAATALGCSEQTVRNITAPFNSENRTRPRDPLIEKIVEWTNGEITAGDFYPPHLADGAVEPAHEAAQ